MPAAVAVFGSLVAWLTLGRQNPLQTVYEHRDERLPAAEQVIAAG